MATHRFQPTHYYTTLGSHPPVLRIASGDTVITTTVDSGGRDAHGKQVSRSPNPQTGPFYIEGAEIGDTLAVHLDRLWPNRDLGYTNSVVMANVVDPGFVRELPSPKERQAQFKIDRKRGTATLDTNYTNETRRTRKGNSRNSSLLRALRGMPLAPMLGCFGVAPSDGQAISASTAGPHGGNMDYRRFCAGATVYFPILVRGALLHVGDGHALQADGEILGTGIEISFDVQFTVRLIKGKRIHWPRGENKTHIFTVGNARPLDQAVQHATTEMLRWLQTDFGLDPLGANLLLGHSVEYEVGNVIDPAYTMVCKVPKRLLKWKP